MGLWQRKAACLELLQKPTHYNCQPPSPLVPVLLRLHLRRLNCVTVVASTLSKGSAGQIHPKTIERNKIRKTLQQECSMTFKMTTTVAGFRGSPFTLDFNTLFLGDTSLNMLKHQCPSTVDDHRTTSQRIVIQNDMNLNSQTDTFGDVH